MIPRRRLFSEKMKGVASLMVLLFGILGAEGQSCPALFSPTEVAPARGYNYSSPAFQSLFADLNATIEGYVAQHRIGSYAVAVVHENRTILSAGLRDTRFRIASITKTFTGLGALMLRERGRLLLDDPVKKHLPGFSILSPFGAHDTTIRELMGHAAGFPRDLCPMLMTCTADEGEILRQIAGMQLISPPWTDHPAYSNLGISLLGRTWEKATDPGKSWEDFVMEDIVTPLRMTRTGWNLTGVDLAPNGNAYARQDLGWSAPAAQMYSTTDDLAKYLVFLLSTSPRLISSASIREWTSPGTIFSDGMAGFSFPWELLKLDETATDFLVTKSGDINGYRSHIAFDPPTRVGVVVLSVIDGGGGGSPDELATRVLRTLIPGVESANRAALEDLYAGLYTCRRSPEVYAPTLNYTVQLTGGTINVTVNSTVGMLADVDLRLRNAGLKVSTVGTWAFLLKNATENSFWYGDGTSCPGLLGAVSGAPDLYTPNAPGSEYTNVVVFDPEKGSLEWPAVGGYCYRAGFPSTGAPHKHTRRASVFAAAVFSLLLFFAVF